VNWQRPINGTIDQHAENNARFSELSVDCGGTPGTPVDEQLIRVSSSLVSDQTPTSALNDSLSGTRVQLDNGNVSDAIVEIDALLSYLCVSSATGAFNEPCNASPIVARQSFEFGATPNLTVTWDGLAATSDCGVFPVGCPSISSESVVGSRVTTTIATPPGKQIDVRKRLRVHCNGLVTPGAGQQSIIVGVGNRPDATLDEVNAVDNASFIIIDVLCNVSTANFDTIDDAAGYYPIFAAMESAPDIRKPYDASNTTSLPSDTGYVERHIDVECFYLTAADVEANQLPNNWAEWSEPAGSDDDQDCLEDALSAQPGHPIDPNDGDSDTDNDGVPDGAEAAYGSNVMVADTDGDGCTDFCELFQETNPGDPDTDHDGLADKPEDDYRSAAAGVAEPSTGEVVNGDDNCPRDFNPAQTNTDSASIITDIGFDATNPDSDHLGDACDNDDDNDDLRDVVEENLLIDPAAPLDPTSGIVDRCDSLLDDPPGAGVLTPTNPLLRDSDAPTGPGTVRIIDGAECRYGGDPTLAAVSTSGTPAANDGSLLFERFNRTQGISVPLGDAEGDGIEDDHEQDPDNDSFNAGTLDTNSDSVDTVADSPDDQEVKRHGTSPVSADTDGDGCSDKKEIASVNIDNAVNNTDLLGVALHLGPSYHAGFDVNKDGSANNSDLLFVALQLDGAGNPKCPGAGANGTGLT
jgi:hypothetical protein